MSKWTLENNVNDWVKAQFGALKLQNREDYGEESSMSEKLKTALVGGSKTKLKTGTGKPDFHMERYVTQFGVPVLIENKLGLKNLENSGSGGDLLLDAKSISQYAANGAVSYAQAVIASEQYDEVIALGIAGDDEDNVEVKAYYVYSSGGTPKLLQQVTRLDFLENEITFEKLLDDARLTEEERHRILINSRTNIQRYAKSLNKLMNNHAINVDQRVIYVSGCLLAMQDIISNGEYIKRGLTPENLLGARNETERDGKKIVGHIEEYFTLNNVDTKKMDLLMSTFRNAISVDADRDEKIEIDKEAKSLLNEKCSLNKQIFTFIYENIYSAIDATSGHLDIMGEMYSEFLKYALSDGKDIGIVLTPPYVTKMMVEILDIDDESKVMDLATGSAGFLISALAHMIQKTEEKYGKGTVAARNKIEKIKKEQLLGVELDAKMFALATTNTFLRGDNSTTIEKGSSFDRPESLYSEFGATRLLLNPPFSYEGNGMPFIEFGLNHMQAHGMAAIIVQDSAGSGKASAVNKRILKNHTLLASIKMPGDLFQPNAGVQTSIYVFRAGVPHDFEIPVKFLDFRKDGYKRTGRGLSEIDHPTERYQDIIKIYKGGTNAAIPEERQSLWSISEIYTEDRISNSGADWNFEQHQKNNSPATHEDFLKTVGDYMAWQVIQILQQKEISE